MTQREMRAAICVLLIAFFIIGAFGVRHLLEIDQRHEQDRQECVAKGGAPMRERGQPVVCLSQPTIPLD